MYLKKILQIFKYCKSTNSPNEDMSPLFPSIRRYKYAGKKALFMFETGSIKKEKGAIWPFKRLYYTTMAVSIV